MNEAPRYGGFWVRLAAVLIDSFLYGAVSMLILYALYGPDYLQWSFRGAGAGGYYGLGHWLLDWTLPPLIIVICWRFFLGTPGKLLMGLNVVDARTGRAVGFPQALLRYLGYFISALPFGLGFLWILWDKRKQGFHDKIARTLVVREDESRKSLAELEKELS